MLTPPVFPSLTLLQSIQYSLAAFVFYYLSWIIYARLFHPYASIPGPFLASITNWWYFRAFRQGIYENHSLPLHKKYGPIVRITPNEVSIADHTAIPIVYGTNPVWQKTDFFEPFNPHIGDRVELFSTMDEKADHERRRIVAPLYTPKAAQDHEHCVERIVEIFCTRMNRAAAADEVVDLAPLCRKFALDVMGDMFFGKEGGFGNLRDDKDYSGWMSMVDNLLPRLSCLGYVPKGMQTLYFISQLLSPDARRGLKEFGSVIEQPKAVVAQCRKEIASFDESRASRKNDMVSKLMAIVDEKGEKNDFTDLDVAVHIYDTIMAGTDTVASVLTSILYYVIKDPQIHKKLVQELDDAFADGRLTSPICYKDAVKLKYLHACIQETLRFSPAGGPGLPRMVPNGGAVVAGTFLPAGYRVSLNANNLHFDKACFGEDAEVFRPERWIENDAKTIANMGRHEITFGAGPRICMGKNISTLEFYQLVPNLLSRFDVELTVPEWRVTHGWIRKASHVNVRAKRRL